MIELKSYTIYQYSISSTKSSIVRKILILFITVLSLFLGGCVDIIPTKSNNPDAIVVNCLLNDGNTQVMTITRTANVEDVGSYIPVIEADAYLFDISAGKQLAATFRHTGDGIYKADYRPQPGFRYLLEINTSNGEKLIAYTEFPKKQVFVPINLKNIISALQEMRCDGFLPDIAYNFQLPDSLSHLRSVALYNYIGLKTELKNTVYVAKLTAKKLEGNILKNVPDNFTIYQQPIIYSHFPIDPFNKLKPDNSKADSYWLYGRLNFKQGVGAPINWRSISFQGHDTEMITAYSFRTVSGEYDLYIKSIMEKAWTFQDPTGLSSMFDINNVYTNITGGYGVFGAYSDVTIYYNGSTFLNIYISQGDLIIDRENITSYMLSVPWETLGGNDTYYYISSYAKWLKSNIRD